MSSDERDPSTVALAEPRAATRQRPKVLYVDDQPGNLLVFKANFKKHFDLHTVTSGAEALTLLDTEEFPIVLSDQKMDGMTGTELLAEVRKRWPDTIRMLVTAYTNYEDAVKAINEGQVFRFISKPWEPQDLLAAILNAHELYWKTRENRALSEQLLHRERLAAIGQVTSGLVHELGNIAAVLTVAHDLKDQLRQGEDVSRELDILQSGVDKFLVLVESLRVYSKGGDQLQIVKKKLDLGALFSTTLVLLRLFPQVKSLKTLGFQPPEQPIVVAADDKKLQQVVLNVVKNAAESCRPGAGEVHVRIDDLGEQVSISIKDNGAGMSPEAAKRVWDGFYTTKGDKGTGLGLVMCRKIMIAHGGTIDYTNNPEGGCTFVMKLPKR